MDKSKNNGSKFAELLVKNSHLLTSLSVMCEEIINNAVILFISNRLKIGDEV